MDFLIYLVRLVFFYRNKYPIKGVLKGSFYMRKVCKTCRTRLAAINYHRNGKTHYRSECDHCARAAKDGTPRWQRAGYKKKLKCDRCGYTSKYAQQFDVYHLDGNLNNCRYDNLKTICANCQRLLYLLHIPWRQGDLIPDL